MKISTLISGLGWIAMIQPGLPPGPRLLAGLLLILGLLTVVASLLVNACSKRRRGP